MEHGSSQQDLATRWRAAGYWALLALILGLGLYLRTAGLTDVQHFNGDQGRDYLEVMRWLRDGHWPLLGPHRSVGGDYTLGPGWYYTIAPALALTGFHPAAGAATVTLLATLTLFLAADWLCRATGSRAAALAATAMMAFSAGWVDQGRTLWNPHALPLGVVGLAWLIALIPRRPAPALATALALMAILPQWHTLGFLVDGAALPFLALALWRARPALRVPRRRAGLGWGLALFAVLALLYLPPLVYELRPGPGNLRHFLTRSALPAQPTPGPLPWRALVACDRLAGDFCFMAFGRNLLTDPPPIRLALAGAVAAWCLIFFIFDLRRRRLDPAAAYLALLLLGFFLLLVLKGESVRDYYLVAAQPALLLLGGWVAGRLLNAPQAPAARFRIKTMLGTVMLLVAVALSLMQWPRAWAIHEGMTPHAFTFHVDQNVARFIAQDSGGRPFSMELAQNDNYPAHFVYLLRWLGRPPVNGDYTRHGIPRAEMGERIYLIVAPGMVKYPDLRGFSSPLPEPGQVANLYIYRLDPRILPPGTRELKIEIDTPNWALAAVK